LNELMFYVDDENLRITEVIGTCDAHSMDGPIYRQSVTNKV